MTTHKKTKQSGVALIMTLLLLVILVVTVGQFSYSTKIDAYIAENSLNNLQVDYALLSALNFAIAQIQLDAMQEAKDKKKYDCLSDEWAKEKWSPKKKQKIGNTIVYYNITDESAKFNLLSLIEKKKDDKKKEKKDDKDDKKKKSVKSITPEKQFDRLIKTIQKGKTIVEPSSLRKAIVSWIKEKKMKHGLSQGAFSKKIPILSMKEFILADGIKPEFITGSTEPLRFEGIVEYTTIWSDGKININTAGKETLKSLSEDMTDELCEEIINYRKKEGMDGDVQIFKEVSDLKKVPGLNEEDKAIYPKVEKLITVNSSFFKIVATAKCEQIEKKLMAIVYRRGKKVYTIYCEYKE